MIPNPHTVEYSVVQQQYHIGRLSDIIEKNLIAVQRNINNGYVLIGVFDSREEADNFFHLHRLEREGERVRVNEKGEIL